MWPILYRSYWTNVTYLLTVLLNQRDLPPIGEPERMWPILYRSYWTHVTYLLQVQLNNVTYLTSSIEPTWPTFYRCNWTTWPTFFNHFLCNKWRYSCVIFAMITAVEYKARYGSSLRTRYPTNRTTYHNKTYSFFVYTAFYVISYSPLKIKGWVIVGNFYHMEHLTSQMQRPHTSSGVSH
jgi:hypothetical protein